MHTYIKTKGEESLWTVGYWANGDWHPLKDFASEEEAARYVNYLNGGIQP